MADLILVLHLAWILWMLYGLARTVHALILPNPYLDRWLFRLLHLLGILGVAAFPLMGELCPLTNWEADLRGGASGQGFVARLIQPLIYFEVPLWAFSVTYITLALFTLAAFILKPPAKFRRKP